MIARHWRGLAKREYADAYVEHLHSETFAQLVQLAGFHDASLLRRDVPQGVEFLVVTVWKSLDAIRSFAGSDVEKAKYYPEDAGFLLEYEPNVVHYEVDGTAL